jgi:hypothetical protein
MPLVDPVISAILSLSSMAGLLFVELIVRRPPDAR